MRILIVIAGFHCGAFDHFDCISTRFDCAQRSAQCITLSGRAISGRSGRSAPQSEYSYLCSKHHQPKEHEINRISPFHM